MTDLILWRHGQTDYNVTGRIQGRVDIPLNETGLAQAARAAEVIASLHPTRIVSSPLVRAQATGAALAELVNLAVETDEGLAEKDFGQWEGLTAAEIEQRWPEEYRVWRQGGDPRGVGVEPRRNVGGRVGRALEAIAAGAGGDDVIVVVSHGAATGMAATHLLGLDPHGWFGLRGMSNCCYGVLRIQEREPGWSLVAWNAGPAVEPSPIGRILV